MATATLHYIYDPLCGWCYGSSPLVQAAREVAGLAFEMHGGGMMAGSARQLASPEFREFVMPHAGRIAALTGQRFGEPYTDGLLRDPTAMFDSEPSTAAILAVQAAEGRGAEMLAHMQKAHFLNGRRIFERAELTALAEEIGVDRAAFDRELASSLGTVVQAHIAASRRLLARSGGQGFPTFALETKRGIERLESSRWLGDPAGWRESLLARIAA
ncbi:MAG: DsbA family protein [Gammaproteobacteria bacterium]